jgi:hypothetical protein
MNIAPPPILPDIKDESWSDKCRFLTCDSQETEINEVLSARGIYLGYHWSPSFAAFYKKRAEEFSRKQESDDLPSEQGSIPSRQFIAWVEEWAQGRGIVRVPSRPPASVQGLSTCSAKPVLHADRLECI